MMKRILSLLVCVAMLCSFAVFASAETQLSDKIVTAGFGTAIDSLTPFRSNTARNAPYFVQLYETLGVMDSNVELQPYAAKSWKSDDNGFTYDVELWDNISDSAGNKITASDVVWFITESKARGLKPVFAMVESVEQTGDYTFSVKFTANKVGTFETMVQDVYIISEAAFKASGDEFATSVISTSPYVVTDFVASASLNMVRRDDYWQDVDKMPECVRPVAAGINYLIITEASQMGTALETKKIDVAIDIPSTTGVQFVNNKAFKVNLTDGPQGWQIFFSGADNSVVANNKELRQAICYAINNEALIMGLSAGYATQMWDVASPLVMGFNPEWKNDDYYSYNLAKAQELLKASGYNGETIRILSSSSANSSRNGQFVQNFLMALGMKVELQSPDMALFTAQRLDGTKYDIVVLTVGGFSLADQWSIRFDPAAYETGDGTSRHDYELAEMLYKTWTVDGWTRENIDAVHEYIKENAYAYGMVNPQVFTIWRADALPAKEMTGGISNYVIPSACEF